jgi:hypothetical protein
VLGLRVRRRSNFHGLQERNLTRVFESKHQNSEPLTTVAQRRSLFRRPLSRSLAPVHDGAGTFSVAADDRGISATW